MTPSKKEKLISCLKKLQMKELEDLIRYLEKKDLSKSKDLNADLTRILYKEVFNKYLGPILANPNNDALKRFCNEQVGPIKLNSLSSTPVTPNTKFKR